MMADSEKAKVAVDSFSGADARVRSGLGSFAVLLGGLGALSIVLPLVFWSEIDAFTVERLILPKFEEAYGFRGGRVAVGQSDNQRTPFGFLAVTPGGRFDRTGVRPGDITDPVALRRALSDSERNLEGSFTVVSAQDWPSRKTERRISLPPWTAGARGRRPT
jgi:hypothetical protein